MAITLPLVSPSPDVDRFAMLLRHAAADGRLRWQPHTRAYQAIVAATADANARADAEAVALLATGLRRRWEPSAIAWSAESIRPPDEVMAGTWETDGGRIPAPPPSTRP